MSETDQASAAIPQTGLQPATDLSHDQLVDFLRRELAEISDGDLQFEEIEPDAHLLDFGYVDSLRAVLLLARIEERFEVEIDDVEFAEELMTVTALARRIRGDA